MKNKNLKINLLVIFSLLIVASFIISGCSKQDNKISNEESGKTNNNMPMSDTSMKMNGNMDDMNNMDNNGNMDKMNMDDNGNMDKMNMDDKGNIVHKMIKLPSVQCDNCKDNLTKVLNKVKGVKSFEIDISNKMLHLNFDKSVTDISKVENAITAAGYDANDKKANPDAYSKLDDCCKRPEDRKK